MLLGKPIFFARRALTSEHGPFLFRGSCTQATHPRISLKEDSGKKSAEDTAHQVPSSQVSCVQSLREGEQTHHQQAGLALASYWEVGARELQFSQDEFWA